MTESRHILMMMSGSVACAKATALISAWRKRGDGVRVACTPSVRHFVGAGTLEGLSGEPVFDDTFAGGRIMDHVELARWADLVVVCPATTNLINKLAAGIADEPVSTLWQAAWGRGVPMIVVPAMNTRMWNYPATRESAARLTRWGAHVLPTADGDLACGERGAGRMLEPDAILAAIDGLLAFDRPRPRGRVLVTGGGTREPIDAVRFIGNASTGRTSAALTDRLDALGYEVTWLGARSAVRPCRAAHEAVFDSFADLDAALGRLLAETRFDLVIHAAAVGDFAVAGVDGEKTRSGAKLGSGEPMTLRLAPNPKLLGGIAARSLNPDVWVVGFKLTAGADDATAAAAVTKLFGQGGVDRVVHNDVGRISGGDHPLRLYAPDGAFTELDGVEALSASLDAWMTAGVGVTP